MIKVPHNALFLSNIPLADQCCVGSKENSTSSLISSSWKLFEFSCISCSLYDSPHHKVTISASVICFLIYYVIN
ncbi:hypothetical protein GRX81_01365 [Rickettsia japonica]|nr:hypothetical protein [Rickettsia japonica]QHE24528.1 hypothetical protein GRX81_01365 [Rickettsia japonica]